MKWMKILFCGAFLTMIVGIGAGNVVYAEGINALPAVATSSNGDATITWGYLGLENIPSILARRYDQEGEPIDSEEFSVSSPFGAPSIFNYDPDVATDSANNSVVTWCSYEFSSPAENIKVVYAKIPPPSGAGRANPVPKVTVVSPQQDDEEEEINLLNIPFSPAIAVDSEDNAAIVWCYYDFESGENGIYFSVVDSQGTAMDPVKIVDNLEEST